MTSILAAPLLFLITAQEQDLSSKITYKTMAAPATRVVSELAEKSGKKLATIPSLGRSVLVIDAQDVVLKDLMDRIATVCSAEWKLESDGTLRLGRSAATENKEERAELSDRLVKVNKALKKIADSLKPGAKSENRSGMFVGMMGGGGGTSVQKICAMLDPNVLASIEEEGRVVFSTNPTRMQIAFRGSIGPIVDEMIRNHNTQIKNAREAKEKAEQDGKPKNEEQEKMESQMQDMARMFGFGSSLEPVTAAPAKVLLVATRGGGFMNFMGGGINLSLNIYDAQGNVILTGQHSLQLDGNMMDVAALRPGAPAKPVPSGTPIEFSKETKELGTFFSLTDWGEALERKPTPELEAKILHPEKFDPLSFSTSEALVFCAKHKKSNLVANIPDSILSIIEVFGGNAMTVESYMENLKSSSEVVLDEAGGWMNIRPARPAESRRMRVDRDALSKFVNAAKSKDVPGLSDYAAYASVCESPSRTPIVFPYMLLFAPNAMQQGFGGQLDWNMLRLYGRLGDAQRQALFTGAQLPFGNLAANQLDIVRKMTFGANAKLQPAREQRPRNDELSFMEMIAQNMPGQIKDFRQEPTEAMPNGLPMNGTLSLVVTDDRFVVADESGKANRRFGALGVDELAMLRYFSEDKNFAQMAGQIPKVEKMRLGNRQWLEFRFRLTPMVAMTHKLNDDKLDASTSAMSLEQLPDAFRKRVERRIEAFKKSPFPMFGMGQATRPPQ